MTRRESLQARIDALGPWFHNLHLDGLETAPTHPFGDFPTFKWEQIAPHIDADLSGRTVLDIGCNAGFYSLEMKRRGAARVVGIDSDPRYLAQARLAASVSGVDLELRQLDVYDVALLGERFDLVLFMGVLYHLRHPLLALDLLHEHVVGHTMVFQSLMRGAPEAGDWADDYPFVERDVFADPRFPRLYFIEHRYAGDPTNWWFPNHACAEAMLRAAGFAVVAEPEDEVFVVRRVDCDEPRLGLPRALAPRSSDGEAR